jgi:hypothetical protein
MDLRTKKDWLQEETVMNIKVYLCQRKKDKTMLQWEKSLQYRHKSKKKQIICYRLLQNKTKKFLFQFVIQKRSLGKTQSLFDQKQNLNMSASIIKN